MRIYKILIYPISGLIKYHYKYLINLAGSYFFFIITFEVFVTIYLKQNQRAQLYSNLWS